MKSTSQTIDIGDGSLLIQLPETFSWEFEEEGTLCAYLADDPELLVLRFSVITVAHEKPENTAAIDLAGENAAQADAHGVAATRLIDRSYFSYEENSEHEGRPIWLRFWQAGFRNHSLVISLCTSQADKEKPGVGEALQLVPRLIKSLCVRDHMSPLTSREEAELEQQREIVADFLREQCDTYSLPRLKSDLGSLQRLVDDGFFGPEQAYEWCCVGVVFGDVLATEFNLDWVTCNDEFGVEPALRYGDTTVMVFPRTMICKRVERGEAVDLLELMDALSEAIEDARRKCA
jgi:hypothetical protein